jgi:uncharacterized lipoprotein YbaY
MALPRASALKMSFSLAFDKKKVKPSVRSVAYGAAANQQATLD